MKRIVLGFLATCAVSILGTAQAQEAKPNCPQTKCEGGTGVYHDYGSYSFTTYSRVYKKGKLHTYETCVENNSGKDMWFNWVIPGPTSWVPKGCALPSPRDMQTDKSLDSYGGCVIFGNADDIGRANFIPNERDAQAINGEPKDCRTQMGAIAPEKTEFSSDDELPEGFATELDIYAPFTLDDVERTLSRINIKIGVTVAKEKGYFASTIAYQISPAYENQPGYYRKEFYVALSPKVEKNYQSEGIRKVGDYIMLNNEGGKLDFFGDLPKKAVVAPVRFTLISANGTPVAAFWVPNLEEK